MSPASNVLLTKLDRVAFAGRTCSATMRSFMRAATTLQSHTCNCKLAQLGFPRLRPASEMSDRGTWRMDQSVYTGPLELRCESPQFTFQTSKANWCFPVEKAKFICLIKSWILCPSKNFVPKSAVFKAVPIFSRLISPS